MQKEGLPRSELLFILNILILMGALVCVAKVNLYRSRLELISFGEALAEVSVSVTGEVLKPGEYSVELGTPLEKVLKKAKPKRFADLSSLPLKKPIIESFSIEVMPLSSLDIQVKGEVQEPLFLSVPPGTRISDLKSKIGFTSETDKSFFRKKRLLKNGEEIIVPKKKTT